MTMNVSISRGEVSPCRTCDVENCAIRDADYENAVDNSTRTIVRPQAQCTPVRESETPVVQSAPEGKIPSLRQINRDPDVLTKVKENKVRYLVLDNDAIIGRVKQPENFVLSVVGIRADGWTVLVDDLARTKFYNEFLKADNWAAITDIE